MNEIMGFGHGPLAGCCEHGKELPSSTKCISSLPHELLAFQGRLCPQKLNICINIKKRSRWFGEEKNLLPLTDPARSLVSHYFDWPFLLRDNLVPFVYGIFKL